MKLKFKSIGMRILFGIASTILGFILVLFLVNVLIISHMKDQFIFEQLEEYAQGRRSYYSSFSPPGSISVGPEEAGDIRSKDDHSTYWEHDEDQYNAFWVGHFKISRESDGFRALVKEEALGPLKGKGGAKVLVDDIMEKVLIQGTEIGRGIVTMNGIHHYYSVDWSEDGSFAVVYLTTHEKRTLPFLKLAGFTLLLLGISAFTARIVSKRIARPIQELEHFAHRISHRDWKAQVPQTDPDEIGRLAVSLEHMRDALKLAEDRDRKFLQSASHDLKTPVMIIKGYAQAILDGMDVDSEQAMAEVIKDESQRLERKITQLLRLNIYGHTLEYGESRETVRIDRLIKNLVTKFSVVRPEISWDVKLEPVEIMGDPEALLVAFENIMENQMRYAKETISVNLCASNELTVTISNDGPQFDIADPAELFETYRKEKAGNFGLGLAIVRQIIEGHHGRIHARNTQNGVEFALIFRKHSIEYAN